MSNSYDIRIKLTSDYSYFRTFEVECEGVNLSLIFFGDVCISIKNNDAEKDISSDRLRAIRRSIVKLFIYPDLSTEEKHVTVLNLNTVEANGREYNLEEVEPTLRFVSKSGSDHIMCAYKLVIMGYEVLEVKVKKTLDGWKLLIDSETASDVYKTAGSMLCALLEGYYYGPMIVTPNRDMSLCQI